MNPTKKPVDAQAEVDDLNDELKNLIAKEKGDIAKAETAGEVIERFVKVYKDPYESHAPHKILKDLPPDKDGPEGYKLGWKQTKKRQERGWNGWEACKWSDPWFGKDGKNLGEFVSDPPMRYQGADQIDEYIRRGDTVLCRLNMLWWKARTMRPVVESLKRKQAAGSQAPMETEITGTELFGPGMQDDRDYQRDIDSLRRQLGG